MALIRSRKAESSLISKTSLCGNQGYSPMIPAYRISSSSISASLEHEKSAKYINPFSPSLNNKKVPLYGIKKPSITKVHPFLIAQQNMLNLC